MRTLVLGATGTIGEPLTKELAWRGHELFALARTDEAERRLSARGLKIVRGDLRHPHEWSSIVREVDAVIHVAATFTDDMGEIDRVLIESLISRMQRTDRKLRFIYTGGCWLFGETGDGIADETTPFDPITPFAWMIENWNLVENERSFASTIVHPAMVYHRDGGAVSRFIADAEERGRIEIWGSSKVRWPVVQSNDLATAYRLVLEANAPARSYCVASEEGVLVGQIVDTLGKRFKVSREPLVLQKEDVIAEQGAWAEGPMLDQQMSGQKIKQELGWAPRCSNILDEIK